MNKRNIMQMKEEITEYVNNIDPWHLIEMGAPEDEYNRQIDRIISLLVNKKPNREVLEYSLIEIFKTKEFELENDKIKELAKSIDDYMKMQSR